MPAEMKRVFCMMPVAAETFDEVLAGRSDVHFDRLQTTSPEASVAPVLAAAHVYQVGPTRDELDPRYHVHAELLRRMPKLLAVSTNGVGYDTVDVAACTAAGVLVANQAGGNKEAVAEHVLGFMLCLSKRIIEADRYMHRQPGIRRNEYMGHDILGKTIGIIGLGYVGSRVAALCRSLFKMQVLACDPYLSEEQIAAHGARKVELPELLQSADYVSVNCPRSAETLNMIAAREFALMNPHAYFITTARGGIHDEAALAQALASGKLAGAGLDVWAREPPPPDHPLLQFDNVMVTPHTAGVTHEARTHIGRIAAQQILDILDGRWPPRLVNPEVWPAYARRYQQIMGRVPQPAQTAAA